jgi:hypothetical protein
MKTYKHNGVPVFKKQRVKMDFAEFAAWGFFLLLCLIVFLFFARLLIYSFFGILTAIIKLG